MKNLRKELLKMSTEEQGIRLFVINNLLVHQTMMKK